MKNSILIVIYKDDYNKINFGVLKGTFTDVESSKECFYIKDIIHYRNVVVSKNNIIDVQLVTKGVSDL